MRAFRKLTSVSQYSAPKRLGVFVLCLVLLWVPIALPIVLLLGVESNLTSILIGVTLYLALLGLIRVWGQNVWKWAKPFQAYGLHPTKLNWLEGVVGFGFALLSLSAFFGLESLLGLAEWCIQTVDWTSIWLNGLLLGIGIGFLEEIFFRGWLLAELQADYGPRRAAWGSALVFAILHFIKPLDVILASWPQFPGLWLLGILLVQAKRWRQGRLGLPIGLHGGWVCGITVVNISGLVVYTPTIPDWVTGVGSNPLASLMGLAFLGSISGGLWQLSRRSRQSN